MSTRLKLLLLELSKYPIGEAHERRLEITIEVKDINSYSHQIFEGLQHNSALVHLNVSKTELIATKALGLQCLKSTRHLHTSISLTMIIS